ncbi:MAG: hypothetical protein RL065_2099 [Bacteroidota bacterium]|jgi:hypothetical protein
MEILKSTKEITIDDIKKIEGNENLSDEEATKIIQDLESICHIIAQQINRETEQKIFEFKLAA